MKCKSCNGIGINFSTKLMENCPECNGIGEDKK